MDNHKFSHYTIILCMIARNFFSRSTFKKFYSFPFHPCYNSYYNKMLSTSDITPSSSSKYTNTTNDKQTASLLSPLQAVDPEIFSLIEKEKYRQRYGIELIASEVFLVFNCRIIQVKQS